MEVKWFRSCMMCGHDDSGELGWNRMRKKQSGVNRRVTRNIMTLCGPFHLD